MWTYNSVYYLFIKTWHVFFFLKDLYFILQMEIIHLWSKKMSMPCNFYCSPHFCILLWTFSLLWFFFRSVEHKTDQFVPLFLLSVTNNPFYYWPCLWFEGFGSPLYEWFKGFGSGESNRDTPILGGVSVMVYNGLFYR